MSARVNNISARLSLRDPQRRSLEILARAFDLSQPHRRSTLSKALGAIQAEFPNVEEFERDFPNLCFALATGVGKTRLMGAFIAYLHLEHGIDNFFVLAPNLTIYDKLITDFTPNTEKYVFRGISEFATTRPTIITADNYEFVSGAARQQRLESATQINIFNISKFNVRAKDARKMRKLSEYLGQSYFDYLSELDDLVLIMDEAHRYRADSSMKSLDELKPILGLELTATPQIESGPSAGPFKNVIFDYPLAMAMHDGYVKEPAVATRSNFNPASMSSAALERLKLEDGIRVHESTKVDLEVYAQQEHVRRVKPFMLVIATDTKHADELVKTIESDSFFEGRYRGRTIQVHSGQKGSEKDENIQRLLAVEDPEEPTEIVVHVNMLKEGWDVTNLYTIVPLRAADSRTLVEQSIGRGLRLPYGRRTGVPAVDRLTIVAHDRFQDIVDEAKKGGYSFSTVHIGKDIPEKPKRSVIVAPVIAGLLGIGAEGHGDAPDSAPLFTTPEDQRTAELTLDAIRKASRDPMRVPSPKTLQEDELQKQLVAEVTEQLNAGQFPLFPTIDHDALASVVRETTDVFVRLTIAIPRVIVLPKEPVPAGFNDFTLDLSSLRLQPEEQEILVQHLAREHRDVIGQLEAGPSEQRLENYVVRGLIDFDDVCYDDHADLLYGLADQVVSHLNGYLENDGEVRNVLMFHQRQISTLVHSQMQAHFWEKATSYEAVISSGFVEVTNQAFSAPADESARRYDIPITNKSDIRNMLFGGFQKCLYPTQKFESDPERRFAAILEKDQTVLKWFKPGKGVFQIRYTSDNDYEPDFVVETETDKLICEPKRADQMQNDVVLAKARAAITWCKNASKHELEHGGKPWRYLLMPHDAIGDNMTVDGLMRSFTVATKPAAVNQESSDG